MFWLVVAALANMALWTVMPLFVESSLRLDAAEGQIGGPFWLLSYPKHPPFWEWLIALSKLTGPLRYFTVYLIGQTFAVGGFALAAWGQAHVISNCLSRPTVNTIEGNPRASCIQGRPAAGQ